MMRKITTVLFSSLLFAGLFQAGLVAAPRFEAGPYVSRIEYEEPGLMKESGVMYGVAASTTWDVPYLFIFNSFRIDAVAGRGSIDYTSGKSGSISDIDDTMIEGRALLGRDFPGGGSGSVSTFTGFGYRRLTDNSGGMVSTTGKIGYDRESEYLYIPVGMAISSDAGSGWLLDGRVEYDFLLKGTQKSALTQVNSTALSYSNDLDNDQYSGNGIKVSAKFSKLISPSTKLAFEPFLRYWDIGQSDAAVVRKIEGSTTTTELWVEPANHSMEYGLSMQLVF